MESTGTAEYVYTVTLPINELPLTTFNLPATFPYSYNDEIINFPSLPIVDFYGSLADSSDVTVKVNGVSWPVVSLDPLTGVIQIGSYPTKLVINQEYTLTAVDVAAKRVLLPGYPIDSSSITLTIVGGNAQYSGLDFHIDGQYLSWWGGQLHYKLGVGDRIGVSGEVNPYVGALIEFTYHIRNFYTTLVIDRSLSRTLDHNVFDGCSRPIDGIMFDPDYKDLGVTFEEYISFVDDYSDGIKLIFFNTTTSQVEDHIFTGPVFEYYDVNEDELGAPDNFPNALIRLRSPLNFSGNPLTYVVDYGFVNDKIVRFRKKTFQELLPSRVFRTMKFVEMLPV